MSEHRLKWYVQNSLWIASVPLIWPSGSSDQSHRRPFSSIHRHRRFVLAPVVPPPCPVSKAHVFSVCPQAAWNLQAAQSQRRRTMPRPGNRTVLYLWYLGGRLPAVTIVPRWPFPVDIPAPMLPVDGSTASLGICHASLQSTSSASSRVRGQAARCYHALLRVRLSVRVLSEFSHTSVSTIYHTSNFCCPKISKISELACMYWNYLYGCTVPDLFHRFFHDLSFRTSTYVWYRLGVHG